MHLSVVFAIWRTNFCRKADAFCQPADRQPMERQAKVLRPKFIVIYVHCTNAIEDLSGRDVYYGASSTVWCPPFLRLPYMRVTAWLWETGMWPVDSECDDCMQLLESNCE